MKISREILVRYGEIFLKSAFVFKQFERQLIENIAQAFKRQGIKAEIRAERGRIFVVADDEKGALETLNNVFGVVSFSPSIKLETTDLSDIKTFCQKEFGNFVKRGETFAVRARRTGRQSFTSKDLENEIGSVIKGKVNLTAPQKEIFLEVRDRETYVFTENFSGPGGLPVGSSGRAVSFLSGGIDSAVSSYLAMKRGCRLVFLHFHSFPLVSKKSIDKTEKIIAKLNDYQFKSKLILVPFQKVQTHLKLKAEAKYLVVLYRRSMARIGEKIAKLLEARAIITGESLGQVSSQTLPNLATIEEAVKIPIFRPLITMDKTEIIFLARKIGTYETSILPQEDCCQLFLPKHPATQAKLDVVKEIENKIAVKKLENKVLKEGQSLVI